MESPERLPPATFSGDQDALHQLLGEHRFDGIAESLETIDASVQGSRHSALSGLATDRWNPHGYWIGPSGPSGPTIF